jgi:DNA-binding PadR family transcriptional regulator
VSHERGSDRFMGHRHGQGVRPFERGGIKFAIMGLLKDKPRHGYDIIRAMEDHSKGMYSPSAGAIYPILQALEDRDLLASTTEGGKRVYSVTPAGIAFLEEHREEARRHEARWMAHLSGHGESWSAMGDVQDALDQMMDAVRTTAGDPAKRHEIRDVLEAAAKKVGGIAER